MKRLSGLIGVEQGSRILFNDFALDSPMWTGAGPREVRQSQSFKEPFMDVPSVLIGISMWDIDHQTNARVDISAENATVEGFEIVFRTWGDTHVGRVRADWMAIGQARDDDDWEVT